MRAVVALGALALATAFAFTLNVPTDLGPDGSRMVAVPAPAGVDEAFIVTPPPGKQVTHISQR